MSCNTPDQSTYCTNASPELKLYQAFIFSVPVLFTLILLLLFCVFYMRRRSASWQSLRMRASLGERGDAPRLSESGIKKEVREMLPVVVFKESFLIRETLCSVCLGDYESDERLQRIPTCGHTFHVDCIDHWLATHTTCPLCRVSLLPPPKPTADQQGHEVQISEDQFQEQLPGSSAAVRIDHVDGVAEERERAAGSVEDEQVRSHREGSVVVVINVAA